MAVHRFFFTYQIISYTNKAHTVFGNTGDITVAVLLVGNIITGLKLYCLFLPFSDNIKVVDTKYKPTDQLYCFK